MKGLAMKLVATASGLQSTRVSNLHDTHFKAVKIHINKNGKAQVVKDEPQQTEHKKQFKTDVISNALKAYALARPDVYIPSKISPEIIKNIAKEENLLGIGKSYRVYSIDTVQDLVLRVPNNLDLEKCDSFVFRSVNKVCDKYNFGEPVAELGYGVQLLSKVDGLENSFPNWVKQMMASVLKNSKIENKDAERNLEVLKAVSQLPEESYVDFAEKIKYLNDTEKTVDCINPNNILLDFKNRRINIIDLWDVGQHKTKGSAGFDHMTTLLCDGLMNKDTRDALPEDKAKMYEELTKRVIEKCKIAAKIVDLPRSKYEILTAYDDVEKSVKKVIDKKINYVERYKDFCDDYGL